LQASASNLSSSVAFAAFRRRLRTPAPVVPAAAAIPLASVLPVAGPGRTLWLSPDLLSLVVPTAGVATLELALPNSPVLVGASIRQQVVSLDLGAAGALIGAAASNALLLSLGVY